MKKKLDLSLPMVVRVTARKGGDGKEMGIFGYEEENGKKVTQGWRWMRFLLPKLAKHLSFYN